MNMTLIKMNQMNNYFLLEIIIFHLVGKTSLIAKYCEERISRGENPTINEGILEKIVDSLTKN